MSFTSGDSLVLETIFRQLDLLDDNYENGFVSHIGLRRLILESPELEMELGSPLTRALLNRSEVNLYGRLGFHDFIVLADEVFQSLDSNQSSMSSSSTKKMVHKTAVTISLPSSERHQRISYLETYSCLPPPLFMILLSLSQMAVFIWHVLLLSNKDITVGLNGPPYIEGLLIFHPEKKYEVWRFVSYMFVHSGYLHVIFNILMQLMLGIPLEMVHRWWRITLIYLTGVMAGSLSSALADPNVYLAGASGGVYALITAHLANIIFNWNEMEFPGLRLGAFLIVTGADTAVAIYYRYSDSESKVSYISHLGGAIVGLLLGIVILRNHRVLSWERVIWWICLLLLLALFLVAIVWNAFYLKD